MTCGNAQSRSNFWLSHAGTSHRLSHHVRSPGDGIVEKDHEPIIGKPLQSPLEAGNKVAQGTMIFPEDLPDILGFSRFGKGEKATQVTAHHRDLAAVPVEERLIT